MPQHAKLAPDLNAIENVWDLIQDRLLLTAPVEMESRTDFIKRLRRNVTWMNTESDTWRVSESAKACGPCS